MSKQPILRSRYHLSSLAIIILTAILGIAVYKVAIWYRQQAAVVEIHSYRVLPKYSDRAVPRPIPSNPESLRSEPSGRHPGAQVPNIAEEAPLAVHKNPHSLQMSSHGKLNQEYTLQIHKYTLNKKEWFLELSTPKQAVSTQTELLKSGKFEEFKFTFIEPLRKKIDQSVFERCRRYFLTTEDEFEPDWEAAEEEEEEGKKVIRVSMYGHGPTGFHDLNGRWYADRLWCLPRNP